MATEWPPIRKVAANSAYDMFSFHNYLIVILVFPRRNISIGIPLDLSIPTEMTSIEPLVIEDSEEIDNYVML